MYSPERYSQPGYLCSLPGTYRLLGRDTGRPIRSTGEREGLKIEAGWKAPEQNRKGGARKGWPSSRFRDVGMETEESRKKREAREDMDQIYTHHYSARIKAAKIPEQ